jgi:hypothetical protein
MKAFKKNAQKRTKGYDFFKKVELDKIWRLWRNNPKSSKISQNANVGNYSLSNALKREGKSNIAFEFMLNNLTLEELIGLKLEIASRCMNGKYFGIPIYASTVEIVKAALVRFAFSCAMSQKEAVTFLGIKPYTYRKFIEKYRIKNYFVEKEKKI